MNCSSCLNLNRIRRLRPVKLKRIYEEVCECVCVCVSVCVRERECVCERERECVWERACVWERESVCVREREREGERVCVRERERECVCVCVCVCVCMCYMYWLFVFCGFIHRWVEIFKNLDFNAFFSNFNLIKTYKSEIWDGDRQTANLIKTTSLLQIASDKSRHI